MGLVCFSRADVVVNVRAERDAARADGSTQLIQCYCNLPACLKSSGGVQTCTSSLGCFAELVPVGTAPPIPLALDEDAAAIAVVDEEELLRGQYGCLELSSTFQWVVCRYKVFDLRRIGRLYVGERFHRPCVMLCVFRSRMIKATILINHTSEYIPTR